MNRFQTLLKNYQFTSDKDKIVFQETFAQTNKLSEKRRMRVNYVQNALPAPIWYVVFWGALIYMIAAMDYPISR